MSLIFKCLKDKRNQNLFLKYLSMCINEKSLCKKFSETAESFFKAFIL